MNSDDEDATAEQPEGPEDLAGKEPSQTPSVSTQSLRFGTLGNDALGLPKFDYSKLFAPLATQVATLNEGITKSFAPALASTQIGEGLGFQKTLGEISGMGALQESIRKLVHETLHPLFASDVFSRLARSMLPPNLREASDEIDPEQVYRFLEEEGIPLYLIPRAAVAKRLLLAPDHTSRRKVLNDRFDAILDDCQKQISRCTSGMIAGEVHFIQDGINAMRGENYASAQALFTVTLDTLISRFYPERLERKTITNRSKGTPVPELIEAMGIHEAFVWLPIWNSHGQFWVHKGDRIPSDYSRHATIHAVSKVQYNKRNCIQALMLVTSLIGYAQELTER